MFPSCVQHKVVVVIILIWYMQDSNKTWSLACPLDRQLSNVAFPDNLPEPLPMGQVRMKSYLPDSPCPGWLDSTFLEPYQCGWFLLFWLQMCIGKETSWQAKEGAVMCKSLELHIFIILTQYGLYWGADHPLFIFTFFTLIISMHCFF